MEKHLNYLMWYLFHHIFEDLKFIATCSSAIEWKGNFRNPERALVRYQFMEFLVRLAEDKFLKSKQAPNILEATKMMFN
jgi:hypothetical protein